MRPLSTALACLLCVPASAQVIGEAASGGSAGASAARAAVTSVPGGMSAPALTPSLAPGLNASLSAPSAAPAPGAPIPALAPSAIIPIDAAAMKDKGRHYTPSEWGALVAASKDEGTKAVLRSMPGDNPSDPRLTVKLAGGETLTGAFRGLADGKMIFETGGKLVGLKMDAGNIEEVRRQVDVMFDGADLRPDEVIVHSRAPVADPFKDLAKLKGRVVDVDTRDLDDLKWSAQTVSGRVVKADGEEIILESPKGLYHITREFHRVDKVALREEHYSSKDQIASIADVAGKIPDGGAVEVALAGGKTLTGRFFGVRKDARGSYVLIEVPASGGTRFRAVRDFYELRTPGYSKGALLPSSELVYSADK